MSPLEKLEAAERGVTAATTELEFAKSNFLWAHCSVRPGDTVLANHYSHAGKKMRVDSLVLRNRYPDELEFFATGRIIKNDGTVGLKRAEWIEPIKREDF